MRGKILNKIDGIIKSRCAINHAPRVETIIITPHVGVGREWKGFHLFWGRWSATPRSLFYTGTQRGDYVWRLGLQISARATMQFVSRITCLVNVLSHSLAPVLCDGKLIFLFAHQTKLPQPNINARWKSTAKLSDRNKFLLYGSRPNS